MYAKIKSSIYVSSGFGNLNFVAKITSLDQSYLRTKTNMRGII